MITYEKANEMFYYANGNLYRKTSPHPKIKIGSVVGWKDTCGYLQVEINRKTYGVHRIIFLLFNKYLPETVDHINGIVCDNRIENLRAASIGQNNMNVRKGKANTTGIKNVYWYKKNKKWVVKLGLNRKDIYCGSFDDLELAILVAEEARNKYYKEFARHE